MSAKKTFANEVFSIEEKKRVSSTTHKRTLDNDDISHLQRKIDELQYALCTAID